MPAKFKVGDWVRIKPTKKLVCEYEKLVEQDWPEAANNVIFVIDSIDKEASEKRYWYGLVPHPLFEGIVDTKVLFGQYRPTELEKVTGE